MLRLKESKYLTFSSCSERWTIGTLPKEATAHIQVLDLSAQDLNVYVPSWPALRHVRLQTRGDLRLGFGNAATLAATLESFELFDSSCNDSQDFKRFRKELSALVSCPKLVSFSLICMVHMCCCCPIWCCVQNTGIRDLGCCKLCNHAWLIHLPLVLVILQGRRLVPRGKGYNKPKVLEQPAGMVTDVTKICVCGCCTQCLCNAGILSDARSVQEIVPLKRDPGVAVDEDHNSNEYDEDEYDTEESDTDEEL